VSARVAERNEGWTAYVLSFPRAYQGQRRDIRVSYQLPAGRPKSDLPTRVTDAYAHFCWHGQPTDSGTIVAVLPGGYDTETYGGSVRERNTRKRTMVQSTRTRELGRFPLVCTDAFATAALIRTETLSPSGQSVVVEGWPEDPEWTTAITEGIKATLPALEAIIGIAFPQERLTVRQVASQALGGYAGDFIPKRGQIRVGERLDDPALVAHELAHAWSNGGTLEELWMIEGLAEWAGTTAAGTECPEAGEYPGGGSPRLREWRYLGANASREDRAVIAYQYAAACRLFAEVAELIGGERMRDVTTALLLRSPAYVAPNGPDMTGGAESEPDDEPGGKSRTSAEVPVPGWRDWLDTVDEIGLLRAGITDLEAAERLLIEQGVARPRDLAGRAEARAAYHEALAATDHPVPMLVPRLMDDWRFADALRALDLAAEVRAGLEAAGTAGVDLTPVPSYELRLQGAGSSRDLKALRDEVRALVRTEGDVSTHG
jgi:hypothetical protein